MLNRLYRLLYPLITALSKSTLPGPARDTFEAFKSCYAEHHGGRKHNRGGGGLYDNKLYRHDNAVRQFKKKFRILNHDEVLKLKGQRPDLVKACGRNFHGDRERGGQQAEQTAQTHSTPVRRAQREDERTDTQTRSDHHAYDQIHRMELDARVR